ncbi:MAG: beta-propeller fold lactonase family protein [Gemmatimonadetes bacterium]|nr:beta-propeller fold lactonase family protein [Gemmatimonadota bacterium]
MRGSVLAVAGMLVILAGAGVPDPQGSDVLLVTNKSENTLSFFDLGTGDELARIETGPNPHEVAVTPDGRLAFVANYGSNSLTVVDVAKRESLGGIDLGEHSRPHGIVVSSDGGSVWVTTEGSQHLVEVDVESRAVKRAVRTGQQVTHMVALAEGAGKAYTANIGSGTVTAIDMRDGTVIKQIATGAGAEGIAVTPDERYVLVTNREAGTFSVIDVSSDEIVHSMEVGGFPIRVEVTPDGRRALVSQATASTLLEINVADWTTGRSLSVGRMPVGIEILPDGKAAIIANTRDDALTVVDLESFEEKATLSGGDEPDGMAYTGR